MIEVLELSGWLKVDSNGDEDNILFMDGDPLAEKLEPLDRKTVTVRYWISDKELKRSDAELRFMESFHGGAEVDYWVHYSELTGYLWTDENLIIGGHDLLTRLKSSDGSFLLFEAVIH